MAMRARSGGALTNRGKPKPKCPLLSDVSGEVSLCCVAGSLGGPSTDVQQQGLWLGWDGGPFAGEGLDEAEIVALHAVVLAEGCPDLHQVRR